MQLAHRLDEIAPFYVMEVMKAAAALQAQGRDVIHLSVGEPDFTAPPAVVAALQAAAQAGKTQYTDALGTPALRQAIAQHYADHYGQAVDPTRIVVTAGASAALLLICHALLNAGDEVLMPDPCYPCNRHFVAACGAHAKLIPAGPAQRFQLTAADVVAHWGPHTRGVLLASPSNPTGTTIPPEELARIAAEVRARGGFLIVDEIYGGLVYDHPASTALSLRNELGDELGDDVIIINSFSKYFHMTGWRLGWLVMPPALLPALEKLAQNFFICPSVLAQHAALACFTPESLAIYAARKAELQARRDYLVPALNALGLHVPVMPDGAFYVYADCSRFNASSEAFVFDMLEKTGVCFVPGKDFGVSAPERYVRISFATALPRLQEAVGRLKSHIHT